MNNVGVSRVKLAKRDLAIKSKRNQQLVAGPMVYACHISNPVLVYTSKWNTNHTKKAKRQKGKKAKKIIQAPAQFIFSWGNKYSRQFFNLIVNLAQS